MSGSSFFIWKRLSCFARRKAPLYRYKFTHGTKSQADNHEAEKVETSEKIYW